MKKHLSVLMVLATLTSFNQAEAGLWGTKKEKPIYLNSSDGKERVELREQALSALQTTMVARFQEIESDIASGETKTAFLKAKEVLDSVRMKTGIDPKVRLQESFLAATVFSETAKGINDLSEDQKNLVIKTISNFRGGLYMDIMNLSKRTTLLYTKAFEAELSKQGGLTNDDKAKIKTDLVKAAVMPMPVEDKKGNRIFVFEEDVANEDHTYIFNRELMMYLISNSKLKINEASFDEAKSAYKKEVLASLKKKGLDQKGFEAGERCLNNASGVTYIDERTKAKISCFNKHYGATTSFKDCQSLANQIEYWDPKVEAQIKCVKKFN